MGEENVILQRLPASFRLLAAFAEKNERKSPTAAGQHTEHQTAQQGTHHGVQLAKT